MPQKPALARQQRLRLRRTLLGLATFGTTSMVVLASMLGGFVSAWAATVYIGFVLLGYGLFLALIISGRNVRLPRPDLTLEQILCTALPGVCALYFVTDPQVRTALLLPVLAAIVFGGLALNMRRSAAVAASVYALYLGVTALMYLYAPERLGGVQESIVLLAFLFAVAQAAVIGGYVSELQARLKQSNRQLNEALTRIEELAHRDELTGSYNRRYLLAALSDEAERSARSPARRGRHAGHG